MFIVVDAGWTWRHKEVLEFNEFANIRRNDYENNNLGLILEDMHDENVLVNSETLFFIDSVFYTVVPENAWQSSVGKVSLPVIVYNKEALNFEQINSW